VIVTDRLSLRPLEPGDAAAFAAMNADPTVMEFFPSALDRDESDALLGRVRATWAADGIGFGALERRADRALIGMCGLLVVHFDVPFAGGTEIGWRFASDAWGQGYAADEAARAWLDYGFATLRRREIVAFTVPANLRSQAVMRRIGLTRDPDRDFEHPRMPEGHRLRPHLFFARDHADWTGAA
jgi:ribosomal-protein-alanine N-acetyltransferase